MNVPQLLGAIIAVATPLLVVLTLSRAAQWGGTRRVPTPPRVLIASTVVAVLLVAVLMLAGLAQGLVAAISLGLFVLLSVIGWPAMVRIESAAREALAEERPAVRRASLAPRGTGDVVPFAFRIAAPLLVAGATVLVLLGLPFSPARDQSLPNPLLFAGVAVVFCWLYGVWIRREAESVLHLESGEGDDAWIRERRARVLRLCRMQIALVAIFVSIALVQLAIDTSSPAGRIALSVSVVVGGIAGVIGCAIAISSGITPAEVRRSAGSGEAR